MNLYDTLIQKVDSNRRAREDKFITDVRAAIERRISNVGGFSFPVTIQVRLQYNECCDEMMTLVQDVLRREGFENFKAQFGKYNGDVRDVRDVSYSYVQITINKNHKRVEQ
ncbi:hypothetical protein VPFG_00353 [Vibrio phage nt-1]|uniref:Uncharacterized protein n=1 Tax=Vibrio phage nt-1 TaxID=115992 RepID=R9TJ07_9CAUD|nr:hypothetical protein VPFG_00353 [Vibrio phage nt-1]AGN30350.1 hypothetical protein VPFG_00353 [Vibrio phage nt-1]